MLIDFNLLPDTSRVWIYQCNRTFTKEELLEIKLKLNTFLENWAAHGSDLKSGYQIKYSRFIILATSSEGQQPTGCSIDDLVRLIQQMEKDYNVNLLDKMNVSFKHGEFVAYKPLVEFRKMGNNRAVSKKTVVFNNLVSNIAEYRSHWEVPAEKSWHAKFLN